MYRIGRPRPSAYISMGRRESQLHILVRKYLYRPRAARHHGEITGEAALAHEESIMTAAEAAERAKAAEEVAAGPRIRPAARADIPQVAALDEQTTGRAKPDYWAEQFARYGAGPGAHGVFLVAEAAGSGPEPGRIVGFIVGEVRAWEFGSPPCGWVFAVSVDRETRLEGVGGRLLAEICTRFKAAGMDTVRTMLARDDPVLMSFFRAEGMMAGPYVQLEKDLD